MFTTGNVFIMIVLLKVAIAACEYTMKHEEQN